MHVQRLLFAHGGLPGIFFAPRRLVVVADENPRVIRQCQDLLDRIEQCRRRAAGKIATRGSEIGHEQRVADKGGIADHIGQTGRRMARRVHHLAAQLADMEAVALLEQGIKLRPVALKLAAFVEHLAEGVLHHGDLVANADLAAQMVLQIGRRRQVIGMDMGFQDPFGLQPGLAHIGADAVGRSGAGAARGVVEIQHRIDDRAGAALGVAHHVGHRVCRIVEEGFHVRYHRMILHDGRKHISKCEYISSRDSLTDCYPLPARVSGQADEFCGYLVQSAGIPAQKG